MKSQHSSSFVRLATFLRRGVLAIVLVVASAAGAMATPLTMTHSFGFGETPISTFDTNLGTLHDVQIQLTYTLQVNTFTSPDRANDWCSATLNGSNVSVSATGTPVLYSTSPNRPTEFLACDSYWILFIEMHQFDVDPLYFDAFTSVGPSSLSIFLTQQMDSITVRAYDPDESRQTHGSWQGGGSVTYSYTPVPEPTTAVMLTLGLAGMVARRYRRRA
jgi:hypothetical protein